MHPAERLDLDDDDVGRVEAGDAQRVVGGPDRLVGGQRDADAAAHLAQLLERRAGLLDVLEAAGGRVEPRDGQHRGRDVPRGVRVDPDAAGRAERVADRGDAFDVGRQVLAGLGDLDLRGRAPAARRRGRAPVAASTAGTVVLTGTRSRTGGGERVASRPPGRRRATATRRRGRSRGTARTRPTRRGRAAARPSRRDHAAEPQPHRDRERRAARRGPAGRPSRHVSRAGHDSSAAVSSTAKTSCPLGGVLERLDQPRPERSVPDELRPRATARRCRAPAAAASPRRSPPRSGTSARKRDDDQRDVQRAGSAPRRAGPPACACRRRASVGMSRRLLTTSSAVARHPIGHRREQREQGDARSSWT